MSAQLAMIGTNMGPIEATVINSQRASSGPKIGSELASVGGPMAMKVNFCRANLLEIDAP